MKFLFFLILTGIFCSSYSQNVLDPNSYTITKKKKHKIKPVSYTKVLSFTTNGYTVYLDATKIYDTYYFYKDDNVWLDYTNVLAKSDTVNVDSIFPPKMITGMLYPICMEECRKGTITIRKAGAPNETRVVIGKYASINNSNPPSGRIVSGDYVSNAEGTVVLFTGNSKITSLRLPED
jgi:hypothetical protein